MKNIVLLLILLIGLKAENNNIHVKNLIEKHTNIAKKKMTESVEKVSVRTDRKNYGKNKIAIIVSYRLQSHSNPYFYDKLWIYEVKKNEVKALLSDFKLSFSMGDKGSCDYREGIHQYEVATLSSTEIVFAHHYSYSHEEFCKENKVEKWSVKLEPMVVNLKDGKYVQSTKKEQVLFNLSKVYLNVKKGLKYRKIVLEAMLLEEPIHKNNVEIYSKIANQLNMHKHKEEATFLLDAVFRSGIETALGFATLADIYYKNAKALEEIADKLFKEGQINPSAIATQSNANLIKSLMLYKKYEQVLKKEGIHSMGKIPDEQYEYAKEIIGNDMEFIKTGIYVDATVYDYLSEDLKDELEFFDVTNMRSMK